MKKIPSSIESSRKMDLFELVPYLLPFTKRMEAVGFTTLTINTYSDAVCHFGTWLHVNSISPCAITNQTLDQFSTHCCDCSGWRRSTTLSRKYLRRVKRFVEYLAEIEVVTAWVQPETEQPVLWDQNGYTNWLSCDRGLAPITVENYVRALTRIFSELGHDVKQYTSTAIRRVVCEYAEHHGSINAKDVTTALRSYLKYQATKGLCSCSLIDAVPTVAHWRLSALPRYISTTEVQRVVCSCDTSQRVGLRDHAILLLLSRLGLRASDIVNLRVSDIDWDSATVLVRGKSRKVSRLPLPQDAGDAILRYLEMGRVNDSACKQLFLCVTAPHRPLSCSSIVSDIVRAAIVRSGIDTPPFSGAHLLRHSAATGWLRDGVTPDTISTILRHSSANMTMHYAKIDVEALSELVVSWPGGAS